MCEKNNLRALDRDISFFILLFSTADNNKMSIIIRPLHRGAEAEQRDLAKRMEAVNLAAAVLLVAGLID